MAVKHFSKYWYYLTYLSHYINPTRGYNFADLKYENADRRVEQKNGARPAKNVTGHGLPDSSLFRPS